MSGNSIPTYRGRPWQGAAPLSLRDGGQAVAVQEQRGGTSAVATDYRQTLAIDPTADAAQGGLSVCSHSAAVAHLFRCVHGS